MIVDALLFVLHPLLTAASNALPTYTLPTWDSGGVVSALSSINYMLPIADVFALVFVVLALGPAFCTVTLGLWLIGLVRGGGNRA